MASKLSPHDPAVKINRLRLKQLLACEGNKLPGELRAAFSSGADHLDTFLTIRVAHLTRQQTRIDEHDGEQVIEIVGNPIDSIFCI
jgi:hypothetical protein